jgi:16S rRNA (cytosine1402-N4)-methyltransferase
MVIKRGDSQKENSLHIPVLLNEVIQYLNPQPNQHFIDATLGGGGHSEKILELTSPKGVLFGFDLDPEAVKRAKGKLRKFKGRAKLFQANFTETKRVIYEQSKIHQFSGFLLDLGLSSYQLESKSRGFSFQTNGSLDMRFGQSPNNLTATEILNKWPKKQIEAILQDFGEERYSHKIAQAIQDARKKEKIINTSQLVEIIASLPSFFRSSRASGKTARRLFNSSLTAILNAWKVLVAG